MVDSILARTRRPVSPLHHASASTPAELSAALTAAEYPNLGYIVIRGRQDDPAFMSATEAVLGAALPCTPGTVLRCRAGVILWQSPDEWWLACARADRDAITAALEAAVSGLFAQVADNSGGLTALHVAGPDCMTLLRHLTPYDVESLATGHSASTAIAKGSFTILRVRADSATLVFRRSFAAYIWRLIDRAATPYGLRLVAPEHAADGILSPLLAPQSAWKAPAPRAQAIAA